MAVTRDNVIVISHDPILHAPMCSGPREGAVIRELTLAEVRQWDCGALQNPRFPMQQTVPGTRIATLDEVFRLTGDFDFHIEAKSDPREPQFTPPPEEYARLVLEKIREHGAAEHTILLSFDFRILRAMRLLAPDVRLSALTEGNPDDVRAIAAEAGGAEMISPQYKLVTKENVAAAHAAGVQVVPWTANSPQDWDRLIETGVDAVVTDDPAALIVHLQNRGLR